jgi:hypothetical protein
LLWSTIGDGSFDDATALTPVYTPGAADIAGGNVTLTLTANGNASCAPVADDMVVTIQSVNTPTAVSNSPICQGSDILLSTPEVVGATYSWSGPNGFASNQRAPVINNATLAEAGTYLVVVTEGACSSMAGTTDVVVLADPPPTAILSGDTTICSGGSV